MFFSLATAYGDEGNQNSIEEIARKYRPTKVPVTVDAELPVEYQNLQKVVNEWHTRTKKDSVARFIMDNFYPTLRGVTVIASGKMVASKVEQILDMREASSNLKEVWVFRNNIAQGGTRIAGQAVAQLLQRFASRADIHERSKDTGSSPYEDLKGDISRLPSDVAYRFDWGFKRLGDFGGVPSVAWTPALQFQLGEDNQDFIRGFMDVQFPELGQEAPTPGSSPKQASLDGSFR
ncbi:MAG: hypothetical protein KDD51_17265 [Bdellovibrionales bacterium]|nr:hypothetical protein [Bdellovibrionales bacterium]MCB0418278.1 hypothetical protein [Bdellovibrionales bacterium]MCB9254597.1 hypothetical protein [Pseudobdellovibrionaceae bacterium]